MFFLIHWYNQLGQPLGNVLQMGVAWRVDKEPPKKRAKKDKKDDKKNKKDGKKDKKDDKKDKKDDKKDKDKKKK